MCSQAGKGHIIEPKRQIKHVVKTSGVPFTSHYLRRSFLTIADVDQLSPYTIKRLANHSTRGDVTAGYVISDVERLRTPMESIESFICSAIHSSDRGLPRNIVPPRRRLAATATNV
jgi:hypothetical protein